MGEVRKNQYHVVRDDTQKTSDVTGVTPRQAALMGARQLAPVADTEDAAQEQSCELRIHEHETDILHIYEAWAWEEKDPPDHPDWLPERRTDVGLAKKGKEDLQR